MSRAVSDRERELASELDRLFGEDAKLAERLNDAHQRLHETVCGWGIHPDGLAAVYGEHPAAVDAAFAREPLRGVRRRGPAAGNAAGCTGRFTGRISTTRRSPKTKTFVEAIRREGPPPY